MIELVIEIPPGVLEMGRERDPTGGEDALERDYCEALYLCVDFAFHM